ncbi:Cullin-associated NEDD8-dissociated protein 1 [Forsythia ovata]|uniref:Cullin-associated NEDD8-dissociated protein 1 n=1 Tax=Forsythia ovata TaxID=205694 RepID=A0ABD1WJE8_9LAMI
MVQQQRRKDYNDNLSSRKAFDRPDLNWWSGGGGVGGGRVSAVFALLCLGEIGKRKDLSSHTHIENIVIESFQSPFEEIKSAVSYALGNIVVGNLPKYLPFILDKIDNQQKKQYPLLHSLKEVIVRQYVDKAEFDDSSVEKITSLLFNHCESDEEGVRNVVAECLGKIALIEPGKLVPALKP